ncbi:hypothetical protein GW17_00038825 [Ensete ventricosum]|nr:hypothetical protein GW17_00038825 [Ensete ventricosum]
MKAERPQGSSPAARVQQPKSAGAKPATAKKVAQKPQEPKKVKLRIQCHVIVMKRRGENKMWGLILKRFEWEGYDERVVEEWVEVILLGWSRRMGLRSDINVAKQRNGHFAYASMLMHKLSDPFVILYLYLH